MPANLTADFLKAREELRAAKDTQAKLAALEKMLATIPKHKGTDHMQADIKRRIAKLKEGNTKSSHHKGPQLDHIEREGAGQVVLLGPPNSGKSSLLAALTNAHPEVADYPYSTILPLPGMMAFEDVQIQLVDLPPISAEYSESWLYSIVRQSDLSLLALDGSEQIEELVDAVEEILLLLEEHHIRLVQQRENAEEEEMRVRDIPCRIVLTRGDLGDLASRVEELSDLFPVIVVSPVDGTGLDNLREQVFFALNVIRVYTKLPGKPADMVEPYVLPAGSMALDAVGAVHREFVDRLKYIRVWGSGRFDGQQVPTTHVLADKDIIEIHLS